MAAATELCAKLHHLVIQSADTYMSRLNNAPFQAQDQHKLKGAKVTSVLSERASSNLAKDNSLMPPSDGILGTIIPSLIQWSSIGRPIRSSCIKPSKIQLKVYNSRASTTGSCWSGWIWANPTSLRELNNQSLWKASTKPKHSTSYNQHQPSGLTEVLSNSTTHSIKIMASSLTMANKDSCTKLCTRKLNDWQPSHLPIKLKGVSNRVKPVTFNTFASNATSPSSFLFAATFHFANHFQSTVISTHSIMTTWEDSKPVEGNTLRTPYHHLGPVT